MVRQYPLDPYYDTVDSLPDFAALAMAYVVLILKLLFGIDGNTEKFVSLSLIFLESIVTAVGNSAILQIVI